MRIGFGLPVAGSWAQPQAMASFASRAEELGYDSLWAFQRLLVPAADEPAPVYRSVLDPLISLGFAAAHTSKIRLGVSIVNLPFVSPALLAKQASTLDVLSGGRLDLGLGIGWSPVEFAASGADLARRAARAAEYLAVLHTLWADEVSEFHGEFYEIPPSRMWPKPVQRPGPPVLLAGMVPAALQRAGRLAAGWLSSSRADLATIGAQAAIVRQGAEQAGRDPASVRIVCRGVVRADAASAPSASHAPDNGGTGGQGSAGGAAGQRMPLTGSYEQIRADVAWLGEQGVTELFYDLNWDPLIGSPDADPDRAAERATEILQALAPGHAAAP
jgi:probable F420-dependent oxidoreductase